MKIIERVKKQGLNVWCYSGYQFEDLKKHELFRPMLEKIDVLVDGQFMKDKFHSELKFRGSENQRIIEDKKSLISSEEQPHLHHP